MRLLAIGGDRRMLGAVEAARKAGWESAWAEDGCLSDVQGCDAVLLPWPHSVREARLVVMPPHRGPEKEELLKRMPPCALVLHGSGIEPQELEMAREAADPARDELFLRRNAQLTAEGAVCRVMQRMERALLGSTCLITGYGRIGQELAARLTAMGAFVIVCARSEIQMRASHAAYAHPVPLSQLASAAASADVVFNTVPARIIGERELAALKAGALLIELASAPYGVDIQAAKRLGVDLVIEGGVPGRYAPMEAGAALFEVVQRHIRRQQEGK